jgi:hypothetical protein
VSNARTARAHKKSRPELSDQKCSRTDAFSAQSDVAGDGQKQDASFVEDKRKPDFVIELCHAIMIAENGSKIKKKYPASTVTSFLHNTYDTRQLKVFRWPPAAISTLDNPWAKSPISPRFL